jgi:ligand-binding sensor domain-containing protein
MSGGIRRYVEPRAVRPWPHVEARKPPPAHAGWTTFASQRSARAIAIDPDSGRLWVATWGGVLSWDRQEGHYVRYGSEHGLAAGAVSCVAVDSAGRAWAGHDEGGLSWFDGRRWYAYDQLPDEPIRAACAAAGGLWVAGPRAVLVVPAPDRPAGPVAEGEAVADLRALLAHEDGVLAGGPGGLLFLRPGQRPAAVEPGRLRDCAALARDGAGAVWAATPSAVWRLDGGSAQGPYHPPDDEPSAPVRGLAASKGGLWVLTAHGLARVADGRWQTAPGLVHLPRAVAARPGDAHAWLGTDDRLAVVWWDGDAVRWQADVLPAHPEDALNNLARCVVPPGAGRVAVGTAGGLVAFEPGGAWSLDASCGDVRALCPPHLLAWPHGVGRLSAEGRATFLDPQPDGVPLALASGRDGLTHVLTTRALWRLGDGAPAAVGEGRDGGPCALAQAPDGAWWLGTARGVFRLAGGRWELSGEHPGPVEAEVNGLAVVGGDVWVAAATGLWQRREGGWRHHPAAGDGALRVVAAAGGGALWLAAADRVLRYDPAAGAVRTAFTPADSGLPGRQVTGLLEHGGSLWVTARGGVGRLTLNG